MNAHTHTYTSLALHLAFHYFSDLFISGIPAFIAAQQKKSLGLMDWQHRFADHFNKFEKNLPQR
jgi:hypothetical protein